MAKTPDKSLTTAINVAKGLARVAESPDRATLADGGVMVGHRPPERVGLARGGAKAMGVPDEAAQGPLDSILQKNPSRGGQGSGGIGRVPRPNGAVGKIGKPNLGADQKAQNGQVSGPDIGDALSAPLPHYPQEPHEPTNAPLEDHPAWIPQRLATSKKASPMAGDRPLVDMDALRQTPKLYQEHTDLLRNYPNMPEHIAKNGTPDEVADHFIGHVKGNLLALHDAVPPQIRTRSRKWYDGARSIVDRWTQKYGVPEHSAAGVLASLSPQKDWFQNVSLADRVLGAMKGNNGQVYNNHVFDNNMANKLKAIPSMDKPEYQHLINIVHNNTLHGIDQLHGLDEKEKAAAQAMWLRVHDETYADRGHHIVTPEGNLIGKVKSQKGADSGTGWGSLVEIGKAIQSIKNAGSPAALSALMGEKHKVRNFFNNILSPNSKHGDVTIDTHAVAAGLWRALSGNSLEVAHNFGNYAGKNVPGAGGSAMTGIQGTYPFYAEAYRQAAKERGILPREMQSITWEAIRGMFPDTFKTAANNNKIDDIWLRHRHGEINQSKAQELIHALAGGIRNPSWAVGGPSGADAQNPHSGDAGKLSQALAPGESPQAPNARAGRGIAPGIAQGAGNSSGASGIIDRALKIARHGRADGGPVDDQPEHDPVNESGLYSHAAELAKTALPPKAPLQQMLSTLQNKGVKPEEMKWGMHGANDPVSGITPDAKGNVTNQQVRRQFLVNQPEFDEVQYGPEEMHDSITNATKIGKMSLEHQADYRDAMKRNKVVRQAASGPTKYSEYSMPGGYNYRELLLKQDGPGQTKPFSHNHWPEDHNVAVHLRMKDRHDEEGNPVLHLDELQSDWGQKGRQKGFGPTEVDEYWYHNPSSGHDGPHFSTQEQADRHAQENYPPELLSRLQLGARSVPVDRVPEAPHVTSTEGWTDLGLKRALVEAARHGYDKLAWTPASEHKSRYNLAQHIDHLEYLHSSNSLYGYKNGRRTITKKAKPEELPDMIGKELTNQLMSQPHHPIPGYVGRDPTINKMQSLKLDKDKEIGGEWADEYYGKMLPRRLSAITRKLDPDAEYGMLNNVAKGVKGNHVPLPYVKITPKMREAILKGLPAYRKGGRVALSTGGNPDMSSADKLSQLMESLRGNMMQGQQAMKAIQPGATQGGQSPGSTMGQAQGQGQAHQLAVAPPQSQGQQQPSGMSQATNLFDEGSKDLPALSGMVPQGVKNALGIKSGASAQPGQDGAPGSSMDQYKAAIAKIESNGGDYGALGPTTKSGDHAYGKYQVMGANIPSWTKAALGQSMTPQQFLADPKAQEAVFEHQFGQYVQQYGPQDAASVWFTGRPLKAGGAQAADVNNMTGQRYADTFMKYLGSQPQQDAGTPANAAPLPTNVPAPPQKQASLPTSVPAAPAPGDNSDAANPTGGHGADVPNLQWDPKTNSIVRPSGPLSDASPTDNTDIAPPSNAARGGKIEESARYKDYVNRALILARGRH